MLADISFLDPPPPPIITFNDLYINVLSSTRIEIWTEHIKTVKSKYMFRFLTGKTLLTSTYIDILNVDC